MKQAKGKASLIGSVGGIFIGASILLFIVTIVLTSLKNTNTYGHVSFVAQATPALNTSWNATSAINKGNWAASNATVASLLSFFTIAIILLGVMGITLVGGSIIGYITGMFG